MALRTEAFLLTYCLKERSTHYLSSRNEPTATRQGGWKGIGRKRQKEKQPQGEVRKASFWGGLFCLELVKHNYKDVAGVLPLKFSKENDCWINRPQNATLWQTEGAWPMTLCMKVQRDVPLYTSLSSPALISPPLLHLIQAKREREKGKKSEIHVIHFASHLSLSLIRLGGRAVS